ncbi:hypothetical protein GLOIN_2v1482187 [Rhizophagus irregularis DAOM 181602=DAOM 197198]|uniref:Uncharacterized protein n=1 Tax=Rhizophagus irregularis (strain DAOM 181602 / DAOM 197198 / MUCL 43194) TaxID=747089 RepID=A0A2P4PMS8_RHIID|nr:hypothetical protein GLOIN_2v1482187 [Rhizophagus irregularis DAOM 181602=DAOM 197198]POG66677.1 hypothetical protein GLOIN_2v1482187 [Rhizophagus irregularis DAOM 181602=DAOM 197198]|eukprot:XP_025173543.1 hypothetical protein GLOIN_2v1482187 [Rhizophagus irregularis DAOM 181602=DAOM 197198]
MKLSSRNNNNWIIAAIKILNNENINLCDHEIINKNNENHIIKGGKIDITEILSEKNIFKSALSRKNKKVIFIEDTLELDGITMMKWKHVCKELGEARKTRKEYYSFLVFAKDKKRSHSKNYQRMGIYYTFSKDRLDMNNSPLLKILLAKKLFLVNQFLNQNLKRWCLCGFTGCWPELKHSAILGFRNSGQDLISTGIQKSHTTYIYS